MSYVLSVDPAFSSVSMLKLLPLSHAEAASQLVAHRFWTAQYLCGLLALAHMLGEKLYTGRPFQRPSLCLVLGLLGLALFSATWVQPKLERYHLEIFGTRSTPQQRVHGQRSFVIWNGILTGGSILMVLGLSAHLLQTVASDASQRFVVGGKFRG